MAQKQESPSGKKYIAREKSFHENRFYKPGMEYTGENPTQHFDELVNGELIPVDEKEVAKAREAREARAAKNAALIAKAEGALS